jgi:hypothetical protein
MINPQATEQYGQVFRVSVVRASLKVRTSASASLGENPRTASVEPLSDAALNLKN